MTTDVYRFSHEVDAHMFLFEHRNSCWDTTGIIVVYPKFVHGQFERWVTLDDDFQECDIHGRICHDHGHVTVAYPIHYKHLFEYREGAVCYGDGGRVSRLGGRWVPLIQRDYFSISSEVVSNCLVDGYFSGVHEDA